MKESLYNKNKKVQQNYFTIVVLFVLLIGTLYLSSDNEAEYRRKSVLLDRLTKENEELSASNEELKVELTVLKLSVQNEARETDRLAPVSAEIFFTEEDLYKF